MLAFVFGKHGGYSFENGSVDGIAKRRHDLEKEEEEEEKKNVRVQTGGGIK